MDQLWSVAHEAVARHKSLCDVLDVLDSYKHGATSFEQVLATLRSWAFDL